MTTNVLLLHYNNYFNRTIKRLETVDEYKAADTDYHICNAVNFVPGDGLITSLTLGFGNNPTNLFDEGANCDYMVVMDADSQQHEILSRWFVVEAHRTRQGQYELILKRDVIADNLQDVLDAPTYIEKGYIASTDNPLLYNSESLLVNQIKRYEEPIKDETKIGWVVGYIPRDSFAESTTVNSTAIFAQQADITLTSLESWAYWKYCVSNPGSGPVAPTNARKELMFKIGAKYRSGGRDYYAAKSIASYISMTPEGWWQMAGQSANVAQGATPPSWYSVWSGLQWNGLSSGVSLGVNECNAMTAQLTDDLNSLNTRLNTYLEGKGWSFDDSDWGVVASLNGKIVYDQANNLYYRIRVENYSDQTTYAVTQNETGATGLYGFINNNIVRIVGNSTVDGNLVSGQIYNVKMASSGKVIYLDQVAMDVYAVIDSSRLHLEDAPYDMFCIPYSDEIQMTDGVDTWTCNKAVALSMATDIGAKSGSGNVYDIQLLPYCPNRTLINMSVNPDKVLNISSLSYDIIKTSETTPRKVSAIIWCPKSTFSFEARGISNLQAAKFGAPYESTSTADYFTLTNAPGSLPTSGKLGIKTTGSNGLRMYKVSKSTGIAELYDDFESLSLELGGQSGTTVFVRATKANSQSPYVNQAYYDYNAQSYHFMVQPLTSDYTWDNRYYAIGYFKKPTTRYFDVDLSTPETAKLTNDCNLYRLCAGNYSASFEFSPAKSGGFDGWLIDCTYKPFQPWIHVIPNLKFLYGDDFATIDDSRGLICGGDMSLTQLNNTWANYKLNNKTYQEAFDRTISNMDVNNSISRFEQGWKAASGALTGAAGGAAAGAMVGGVPGAIIGGVAGGLLSGGGGIMDYANMVARQDEARDYAIDMFDFSLQNMKAIPTALSKTSALVANTRVWPFLEVYTCTDVEKEAYLAKLEYDGMSIMAIGKLGDYRIEGSPKFFQGKIIRLPNLKDESHMATAIFEEIKKGVYL